MSNEKKKEANTAIDDTFVDNGDHSWEYYSEGKMVGEDDYNKTAHKSYFSS